MSGKFSLVAGAEQRDGLQRLAVSANRTEARARSCFRLPAGPAPRSAKRSGGETFASKGFRGPRGPRLALDLHARRLARYRATPRSRLFSGESAGGACGRARTVRRNG
jgi:hypothetical protein